MPESVQHRIFVGNNASGIDEDGGYILTPPFTADSTLIFADTTLRTADEHI
jgi:hypothetical protein